MKVVIQRVSRAAVTVAADNYNASIGPGLLLLVGIEQDDDTSDVDYLVRKIVSMRIFSDDEGKMNRSVQDIGGAALIISQFTLHASTKKGNRPSFIKAARPDQAIPLYETFIQRTEEAGIDVRTGIFGGDMQVELVNDGPVTIIMDSKNKQ